MPVIRRTRGESHEEEEPEVFRAASGAGFGDEDAQVYGEFLTEHLQDVTNTDEILALGEDDDSPIHDYFEWDNDVAGHEWRRHQARQLVAHILVEVETEDGTIETRAFHNVIEVVELTEEEIEELDEEDRPADDEPPPTRRKRGYVTKRRVFEPEEGDNNDFAEQVVADAWNALRRWHNKYKEYSYLAELEEAVETIGDLLDEDEDDEDAA